MESKIRNKIFLEYLTINLTFTEISEITSIEFFSEESLDEYLHLKYSSSYWIKLKDFNKWLLENYNNEISSFRDMDIALDEIIAVAKKNERDLKIKKILK